MIDVQDIKTEEDLKDAVQKTLDEALEFLETANIDCPALVTTANLGIPITKEDWGNLRICEVMLLMEKVKTIAPKLEEQYKRVLFTSPLEILKVAMPLVEEELLKNKLEGIY